MTEQEIISACILKHKGKFSGFSTPEPETREEQVVCDADQLDKFGWIGLLQMLKVYIEHGIKGEKSYKTIHGLAMGIEKQKSITLYTKTGKTLSAETLDPDFSEIAGKIYQELSFYEKWDKKI
ncbi:MAG: hypothetical protein JEY99_09920 [Spirochaetales bacterium]|nr:hypothetical protein [Spirochaetales bacterium]